MEGIENISFGDCPYNCHNGVVFNPQTKVKQPCPHCSAKRKEIAKDMEKDDKSGLTISETLRIPAVLTGVGFNEDEIILATEQKKMSEDSVQSVKETMLQLMNNVTLGVLPDYSILFNFGMKANMTGFVFPLLMKGYKAGLKCAPLVYAFDLVRLRLDYEENYLQHRNLPWGDSFLDYVDADLCVTVIDAGSSILDILAVKGLMQLRANRRKPTIIIAEQWSKNVTPLCCDEKMFALAYCCSVVYGRKGNTASMEQMTDLGEVPKMTSQQFSDLFKASNNL